MLSKIEFLLQLKQKEQKNKEGKLPFFVIYLCMPRLPSTEFATLPHNKQKNSDSAYFYFDLLNNLRFKK
jgi:hypothetical protein